MLSLGESSWLLAGEPSPNSIVGSATRGAAARSADRGKGDETAASRRGSTRGESAGRDSDATAPVDAGVKAYEEAARRLATGGTAAGDTTDPQIAAQIAQLKAADAGVRAHEAAHIMVGGTHVRSAASYTYQTGPDGKQYAIGGEVAIDTSPVPGNPQATIQKMETVRAAALAPADPSAADRAVAAAAAQMAAAARAELARQEAGDGASEAAQSEEGRSEQTAAVSMRRDESGPEAPSEAGPAAGAIGVALARQIREAYGSSRTSREESSTVFSAAA